MVSRVVNTQKTKWDVLWWGLAAGLLLAGIGAGFYLDQQSLLIRWLGILFCGIMSVFAFFRTGIGQTVWQFWLECVDEVRRVFWPTRKETLHTTLAVLGMVFVMGLLLWITDFFLLHIVAWLTQHLGG